ncbi:hypothetical protein [Curtobacterium sp. MCBD17_003]|uniref:hypothetical protein n=1 Tax=Curtobacterium sp. MCBD17_003 TaxID=2175667 RepID=UPI000DA92A89|nr:hypothetical protein [Curtobacterium sp. MCBD17_003]WIE55395.1 hypothetical protein DEI88_004075 [Curtobacterium sp. MCBD17_003]
MTDASDPGRKRKSAVDTGELPKTVFFVTPIGKAGTEGHRRAKLVLDYIVKKAFPAPEWKVIRADDEESPDSISTQVIKRIYESDLIVADLSGHNPNVFYELAVAHGYERPVLHMITTGEAMPFDIADQRAIFYELENPESVDTAISSLRSSQEWLTTNPGVPRTPLSAYGAFTAISTTPPGTESNEAIAEALSQIVLRLDRLERSQRNNRRAQASPSYSAEAVVGSKGQVRATSSGRDSNSLMKELGQIDRIIADISALPDTDSANRAVLDSLIQDREKLLTYLRPPG